jgi:hypothetical protein
LIPGTLLNLNITFFNVSAGLEDCIDLCDTLLLCRFITHSPCAAFGFTYTAEEGGNGGVDVSNYVSEVNNGCAIQPGFYSGERHVLKAADNSTLVVKDDCCIAKLPFN